MEPSEEEFARLYEAGRAQLLCERLSSDLDTPVSALLKLGADSPGAFLLESVQGGDWRGRYSIIGCAPDLVWRVRDGLAERSAGGFDDADFTPMAEGPLAALRVIVAESAADMPPDLPPPSAGLFGFLGYDMVRYVERLPATLPPDPLGLPEAVLMRPTLVAVFDNVRSEIALVTVARPRAGTSAAEAYGAATARLERAKAALRAPLPAAPPPAPAPTDIEPRSAMEPGAFERIVERSKAYARAGDIFQVVQSQRFTAPFAGSPLSLYRALRGLNPSPFLFYVNFDGYALVGSSPEILVRVRDRTVTVRPIAGTRPRGATPSEDARLEEDLLADPKERAEHLMLLDLGRNDVGRVAVTARQSNDGGVRVTSSFAVERYSHVMHIVSNVEGKLRPDLDAIDALFAGFPAGTVSGAPKVRAMQIIEELERHRRGAYGGAVGYISAGGDIDTCIALRTAVVKGGELHVQAGAGVVLDSDPEAERRETEHKARALFRAAQEAWRFT